MRRVHTVSTLVTLPKCVTARVHGHPKLFDFRNHVLPKIAAI
eukprot:SAG11_NODE_26486_length_344_cov_1.440816_1_plen_41_part_01